MKTKLLPVKNHPWNPIRYPGRAIQAYGYYYYAGRLHGIAEPIFFQNPIRQTEGAVLIEIFEFQGVPGFYLRLPYQKYSSILIPSIQLHRIVPDHDRKHGIP